MIWYWCYLSYHDCYVVSTISLCLPAKSEVRYHCLSTQFGGELCLPSIWVLRVYLHKCGMVVSLNDSGGYLCITAIWRYCMVYYDTDGTYHDWYLKSHVVSLQVRGRYIVSQHNSGGELCIPTIWVLHVYLHNLGFQKKWVPPNLLFPGMC